MGAVLQPQTGSCSDFLILISALRLSAFYSHPSIPKHKQGKKKKEKKTHQMQVFQAYYKILI